MRVYQINYDLRRSRDYTSLFKKIESYGAWARPLESCWIIATTQTASQIRDTLVSAIDSDDGLLVTRLSGEAAWRCLNNDQANQMTNWLKQQLNQAA